jgi:hypothetical protein
VLRTDERGREERESEEWFGFEIVDGGQTSFGLRYTLYYFLRLTTRYSDHYSTWVYFVACSVVDETFHVHPNTYMLGNQSPH